MKLTEIYESIRKVSDKIWYHGSSTKIDKFDYNRVGTRDDHITNYHGFGIYFVSNINRAKKYGAVITEIKISPTSNIISGKITRPQLKLIYDQLVMDNLARDKDKEDFLNPTYGKYSVLNDIEEFYGWCLRALPFKTSKDVSDFLLRAGIDGMMVINDVKDEILIIFNTKIIITSSS